MSQADFNSTNAGTAPKNALWPRVAYCVGFGIVAYALLWLVFALTILQLIVWGISGERNKQLADFGARLGSYLRQIVGYLMGSQDTVPFPFTPFPEA